MRRNGNPPAKRGPMRDNSRNIAVHMTEEQYKRLQNYMKLTRHGITLYFRKLIHGDKIMENRTGMRRDIFAGVNMIDANVRQIVRNSYARELDEQSVESMKFLAKKLCDEIYCLFCHE